jgi:vacuolar protein sorting-associated protein 13A/C
LKSQTNGRWYLSSKNPLGILINVVTMAGLNINDAPIQFNAIVLEDLHTSPEGLLSQLISKYRGEALRQVHKVIGSADFIGNPVGLFNNITAGVQDVFYEPYHGILVGEGIQELGVGLAKGAKSLVKKTVYSVSDSFSKVTGSVSKGIPLVISVNVRIIFGYDGPTISSQETIKTSKKST